MENKRLGLGLDALFGNIAKESNKEEHLLKSDSRLISNQVVNLQLEKIVQASWQPRKEFDKTSLQELAESIKEHGILQPILVRRCGDFFELIAGERRWRAAKIAGQKEIPVFIMNFDDEKSLEISMIENLQRKDLNPIEKAEGFLFLIEKLQLTQEILAKRLGVNRSIISNHLRVISLSDDIKREIINGKISLGHAKILITQENASELAKEIIEKKLSVRSVEKIIQKKQKKVFFEQKNFKQDVKFDDQIKEFIQDEITENISKSNLNKVDSDNEKPNTANLELRRFEEMIQDNMKVSCKIHIEKNSGHIILNFKNLYELEGIIAKICC